MRGLSPKGWRALLAGAVVLVVAGCKHDPSSGSAPASSSGPSGDCGHTACGSNYFIDAKSPTDCAQGANCTVALTLVATGEFHINDDYPYKFKADDVPAVAFQGTDPAGNKFFSKQASNWSKTAAQKGTMNVVFQSTDKGKKNISGVFKLSVCSEHNCQLEQTTVASSVDVH